MINATTSRLLVAALFCGLIAMFVPAPLKAAAPAKQSCCAHMQMPADAEGDCPMHHEAPADQQHDASCCQACALGLALLFVVPLPFVYAQTGEESLVSLVTRSRSLPQPPPVPPPRSALA